MPFGTHLTTVSIFPHLFSRLDPEKKRIYRTKYKKMKKMGSASVLVGVGASEGTMLVKDLLNSKLKAYGYKSFFAVAMGPIVQGLALPFYVMTYGSKLRKFAVAISDIGAKISKGEMGIVNWAWVGADLIFFGEPVPITDDMNHLILQNETEDYLTGIIEEFTSTE